MVPLSTVDTDRTVVWKLDQRLDQPTRLAGSFVFALRWHVIRAQRCNFDRSGPVLVIVFFLVVAGGEAVLQNRIEVGLDLVIVVLFFFIARFASRRRTVVIVVIVVCYDRVVVIVVYYDRVVRPSRSRDQIIVLDVIIVDECDVILDVIVIDKCDVIDLVIIDDVSVKLFFGLFLKPSFLMCFR